MTDIDIPPGGVRLIREARSEDREEFAEELGVTGQTIGNWERGDSTPRADSQQALLNAIPSEVSLEEVQAAENRFEQADHRRAFDTEQRLFGSKWLQALRDKPRVGAELGDGSGVSVFSDQQRMFVERLTLSGVEGGVERAGERVTTVYYLAGDERRALRRFLETNEALVGEQLQNSPNRFSHDWDEWLYGLLEEEFRFWLYE